MVPVGYEDMPLCPQDAYREGLSGDKEVEPWVIIADNSRKHQTFHSVKWSDIVTDLNQENPNYLDIRNLDKGI